MKVTTETEVMLLDFIATVAKNHLQLMRNVKDEEDCNKVKLQIASFVLVFHKSLENLQKEIEKDKEDGSVEH